MKLVAVLVAAAFVVAAGASVAFADCAGHNKAQMVKTQPQEQMSKDQQEQMSKDQPAGVPLTVAEKGSEPEKLAVKSTEKK
jgi:hypothetical protein